MRLILICLMTLLIASCAEFQASEPTKTAAICDVSEADRVAHAGALLIDGGPQSKATGAVLLGRIDAVCVADLSGMPFLQVSSGEGQAYCAPSIDMLAALGTYGEVIHESVKINEPDGAEVHWILWLNEKTGSWSLTGTYGSTTCLVGGQPGGYAGQNLHQMLGTADI